MRRVFELFNAVPDGLRSGSERAAKVGGGERQYQEVRHYRKRKNLPANAPAKNGCANVCGHATSDSNRGSKLGGHGISSFSKP